MRRRVHLPRLLLGVFIVVYVVIFTTLAFDQHAGMRTHKSDLGQMDQAIWNTSRGRFVESIQDDFLSTRLTDHVEPIFLLISPAFWLWDDVRALLLLQVIFVALGAWPLYELALLRFRRRAEDASPILPWLALSLSVAYLLAPQLQSAVLTEFHAIPLSVPFILWAFWAIEAQRWGHFATATILLASVKEEAALLAVLLGLYAALRLLVSSLLASPPPRLPPPRLPPPASRLTSHPSSSSLLSLSLPSFGLRLLPLSLSRPTPSPCIRRPRASTSSATAPWATPLPTS